MKKDGFWNGSEKCMCSSQSGKHRRFAEVWIVQSARLEALLEAVCTEVEHSASAWLGLR